jgi:DNA-binding transcriptional MerR regulator
MRTVKQVSKASGVTVRALHHYDHIGLLTPPVGPNGYRHYGQPEMLRLQHILFYRELGIPLAEIARILDDPAFDSRAALLDLRRRIACEIAQRHELARTIDRTLALLDAGEPVDERGLFHGISAGKQAAWEAELVGRFGEHGRAAIRAANEAVAGLSTTALLDFKAGIDGIHTAVVELIEAGGVPSSTAAQALMERHRRWVRRSWQPDAKAYAALGRLYCEHAEFRSVYDGRHPDLATFLAQAMAIHARLHWRADAR